VQQFHLTLIVFVFFSHLLLTGCFFAIATTRPSFFMFGWQCTNNITAAMQFPTMHSWTASR